MRFTTAFAVSTVCFSAMAAAQTERDLDSHEHGSATLNIALDADSLFLELETPWNNITGFEHAPGTPEQHAMVDDAMALLNNPEQLFSFEGADCTVTETLLKSSLAGSDHDEHDDHDAEKDHDGHDDHDAEKDHDGHDDHDAEKDHDGHDEHHDEHADGGGETHSSVLASYTFNCSNISQLVAIDAELLTLWSGFEDLDVQLIGPGGQGSLELNPQQIRADITSVQ